MSDDEMKMEDITPNDLGCLGEDEVDPGVKEESAPVKESIPLSFEAIPFKKRKQAKELYDSFTFKDMSFEQFCIELYAIQSPGMMQQDLGNIIAQKQAGYQRKAAIDHSLNRMN